MTIQLPRRHHYVPVFLQRRFADEDGLLHVFDKRTRRVFGATPANVFVKRDLNSTVNRDGPDSVALELWYSQLEGAAKPLTDKIIEQARRGMLPQLSSGERDVWDQFFYHQQKRAPDAYERLGLVEEFKARLPLLIEELEQERGPLTDEQRAELFSDEAFGRMVQNSSVRARSIGSDEVRDVLASRGLAIAIAPPMKSFVLGDHPLSRMGPTGHLSASTTELWLPISPDVAVSPWGRPGSEALHRVQGNDVRLVNATVFANSNIIAGRARALIVSLAGRGQH